MPATSNTIARGIVYRIGPDGAPNRLPSDLGDGRDRRHLHVEPGRSASFHRPRAGRRQAALLIVQPARMTWSSSRSRNGRRPTHVRRGVSCRSGSVHLGPDSPAMTATREGVEIRIQAPAPPALFDAGSPERGKTSGGRRLHDRARGGSSRPIGWRRGRGQRCGRRGRLRVPNYCGAVAWRWPTCNLATGGPRGSRTWHDRRALRGGLRLSGQVKSGHLWTPQIRPFPAPRDGS